MLILNSVYVIWGMRVVIGDHARTTIIGAATSFPNLLDLRDDLHDRIGKRYTISTVVSQMVDRTVISDPLLAESLFSDTDNGYFIWIPSELCNQLYRSSGVPVGIGIPELIRTVVEAVADSGSGTFRHNRLQDLKDELAAKLRSGAEA